MSLQLLQSVVAENQMLVSEVNHLLKENSRMSDYKELMEQLDRDRNKLYTPKGMVEVRQR